MGRSAKPHDQPTHLSPCAPKTSVPGVSEPRVTRCSPNWRLGCVTGSLLGFLLGSAAARHRGHRSVLLLDSPLGSIQLSRDALERLVVNRCMRVPHIHWARARVYHRKNQTIVNLQLEVDNLSDVIPALNGLWQMLHDEVSDFVSLGVDDFEFVLSDIRLRSG